MFRPASALILTISASLFAQNPSGWETLANAPFVSRHNDAYFVTPTLGWIVNGDGQIFRTDDRGSSWVMQFEQSSSHFRSVGFVDSLRGWVGNVGQGEFSATDGNPLYHTEDGGLTWLPVTTFIGQHPRGLCGMFVLNDTVICAVGRVRGPSFFVRTIDGGKTWSSKDMSAYAAGLIDVHFFHPDSGYAVGLTHTLHDSSSGVVLFTGDGGETWERRFVSARRGEWCWKISFPSLRTGYVSLQRNSGSPVYILKTSDGGVTWQEKLFTTFNYFAQGIGFVSETKGWIGGNSAYPVYETEDGGESWHPADFGIRVNRFRFLGDTLGYAVGRTVYRYSKSAVSTVTATKGEPPSSFELQQNFPNPFNPLTTIRYYVPRRAEVKVAIYDLGGSKVKDLIDATLDRGMKSVIWNGTDQHGRPVTTGTYFCVLRSGEGADMKKMLLLH